MANIEGAPNALPGAYDIIETQTRGVSVPGGVRTGVLVGEGSRTERLVLNALGSGKDGFDPTYTSSTIGTDSRHFLLSFPDIIENRTTLLKNGIPLTGLEQAFTSTSGAFSNLYDYRLDVATGHIELQTSALIDQGGKNYLVNPLNIGNGSIIGLNLLDLNAPSETWTVRCASTKRDGYGNPIDGYAKFIAQGSVSGVLLDGYGNQVTWNSNGIVKDNTILQFSIIEGSVKFREGDKFTIQVKGGALVLGDTLVATYIPLIDLNDPEFFTDIKSLTVKHGSPSLTNRVSLGAQIAFANSPPGVWACETAPSIPRRVSYLLKLSASGGNTVDDLTFPLPLNVIPDVNSNIHFFVTDPTTLVESQILPNKVAFYDPVITASPLGFTSESTGHSFSYTVVLEESVVKSSQDGVITSIGPTSATLSSALMTFTAADLGRTVKILLDSVNHGSYIIASVNGGVATISNGVSSFVSGINEDFEVLDNTATSADVLFTKDLTLSVGQSLRVTIVDTRDADFFDANWTVAYEALEEIETDMVVPLPSQTISSIFATGLAHCTTMSNVENRKERVLIIGAIAGLTPDNVTGVKPAAVEDIGILEGIQGDDVSEILSGNVEDLANYSVPNSYGNTFRVIYLYPDQIVVQIGGDNFKIDGFFIAPALIGYLSATSNVAIPATNKNITGFTILRDKLYRPIVLKNLTAAGICVLQPVLGGGKIIWGKTTTQSGFPEEEEISIVFIRDRVAKSLRAGVADLIGGAASPTFQGTLVSRVNGLFKSFVSQGLITAFTDLKVVVDDVDPRQWDVSALISPVYPINWIFFTVGIGTI